MTNLAEAVRASARKAKSKIKHLAFAWSQVLHQEGQRFQPLGIVLFGLGIIIGHRLGQFEIAVVVENGIEADRSTGCSLQMSEVFKTGAGSTCEFLWAWQMLTAMCQGFRFLLQ